MRDTHERALLRDAVFSEYVDGDMYDVFKHSNNDDCMEQYNRTEKMSKDYVEKHSELVIKIVRGMKTIIDEVIASGDEYFYYVEKVLNKDIHKWINESEVMSEEHGIWIRTMWSSKASQVALVDDTE